MILMYGCLNFIREWGFKMKKVIALVLLLSFSFANAKYTTHKQLNDQTEELGGLLKQFCQTQVAQTPAQLSQQYNELRARNMPEQEKAYKETVKFCIDHGFISEDILG